VVVVAVEVVALEVGPEHAFEHSVGVDHRDEDEVEVLPQQHGAVIILVEQEPQDAFHAVGGRGLARVHPRRNHHLGPVSHEGTLVVGEDAFHVGLLLVSAVVDVGDGDEFDVVAPAGLGEHLVVEVDIGVEGVLLVEFLEEVLAVAVGVGVGECELDPVFLCELVLEAKFRLVETVVLNPLLLT
jgi:hypothetical protein